VVVSKLARALLGSGLLAVTLLGGAGGYGIGWLTISAASETSTGMAVPLAAVSPSTAPASPTGPPSSPPEPPKTPVPDNTPPLLASDLSYKTRDFVAESTVHSMVTVKVPRNWKMTQPDPMDSARFTDPTTKRWIRIEAGFTITRPPKDSMAAKVALLNTISSSQALTYLSQQVDPKARTATLTYTYIPDKTLRYVIVRWVALDASGNVGTEISVTGLRQDRLGLLDVLDHATAGVTRTDSPI
jgi:hypothetical protein